MSKKVRIGNLIIGGGEAIALQSMTNTRTADVAATVAQINALAEQGAALVRVAVPDNASARAIREIKKQCTVPIVADIHFDAGLAIAAMESGVDKVRINPGNLPKARLASLAAAFVERGVPVRVGGNGGSAEEGYLKKYGSLGRALAESVLAQAALLEEYGVENIVLSAKASSVEATVEAYRYLHSKCSYPLHLGVTEAGILHNSIVKSSIGIGSLLLDGIGDTIRVSVSGSPLEELPVAKAILRAVGKSTQGIEVVACPTCGRTEIDVPRLAQQIEQSLSHLTVPLKIAVMGCVVNGVGEGKDADIGVAGGKEKSVLFMHGKQLKTVPNEDVLSELSRLALQLTEGKNG